MLHNLIDLPTLRVSCCLCIFFFSLGPLSRCRCIILSATVPQQSDAGVCKAAEACGQQDASNTVDRAWTGRGQARVGGRRHGGPPAADEDQLLSQVPAAGPCPGGRGPHRCQLALLHPPQQRPGPPSLPRRQVGDRQASSRVSDRARWRHAGDPEQWHVQERAAPGAREQGEGEDIVGGLLRAPKGEDPAQAVAGARDR